MRDVIVVINKHIVVVVLSSANIIVLLSSDIDFFTLFLFLWLIAWTLCE